MHDLIDLLPLVMIIGPIIIVAMWFYAMFGIWDGIIKIERHTRRLREIAERNENKDIDTNVRLR